MTETFTAPPHHDLLALVIQIAVLLAVARALGEAAQRLRQPPVLGELLAGILLGPSLLSSLFPFVEVWIVPQTELQGYLLESVALIGVMFLLIITGLETDLALIVQHARTALGVSWGGISTCFTSGLLLGFWLPDFLLADPERRTVFALFVATALSISAIPVIAKVLIDMNLIRRDIGQTILAAGMNDDTVGWILLGIVAGIASAGGFSLPALVRTLASVLLFLALSLTVGRWLVKRSLDLVQDRFATRDRLLTLVVAMSFAWGALTQALELEPVLGAFVMGVLFGEMRRLPQAVHRQLESIALGVFAPIFFAVAGLKVNLASLIDPALAAIAVLVIVVATLGKVAGTYAGARLIGRRDHWTALSYGAGLNARGALEIIIATIGLQLGILSGEMFSIIVLMAMATSLMAPLALRYVLARVTPSPEELERLRREEIAAESLVGAVRRVLLPVRYREDARQGPYGIEARLLERLAGDHELSITLMTVVEPAVRGHATRFLERLSRLFRGQEVTQRVVTGGRAADRILAEVRKDYDLLVLGAAERETASDVLFNPVVDYLVRSAPCPTLVVRGRIGPTEWAPRRILVPTNGTLAARRAAEVAFILARPAGEEQVVVLNVVVQDTGPHAYDVREATLDQRLGVGRKIVEDLCELGRSQQVRSDPEVRVGRDPETVILEMARSRGVDLIVMGTDVRLGSDRLFLGPRVERILNHAPCPVVVVNAV